MKLNILLATIFFVVYFNCLSQNNGIITYKIKITEKKNGKKISEKNFKFLNLVKQEVNDLHILLYFKNENAVFRTKEIMGLDDKKQIVRDIAKLRFGVENTYHYNINDKTIIRENEFDGKYYNITSKFSNVEWNLSNESKIINSYMCFKATTNKVFKDRKGNLINQNIVAWYAPKIPLPLGPKNYVGLPGLIFELNEGGNKIFYLTEINLKPKKVILEKPKKGEILSEKEYSELVSGSYSKFLNSIKN